MKDHRGEDVVIARLNAEDMADVADLEALCFSTPWTAAQLRAALSQPHFIVYGLKRQGRLLAYVSLARTPGETEVLNLATRPEVRRQGLARRLLAAALAEAAFPEDSSRMLHDGDGTAGGRSGAGPYGEEPHFFSMFFSEVLSEKGAAGVDGPEERAVLEVRETNTPARRLYESLGFVVTGRRRGYYRDTGEDALIMELTISRPG